MVSVHSPRARPGWREAVFENHLFWNAQRAASRPLALKKLRRPVREGFWRRAEFCGQGETIIFSRGKGEEQVCADAVPVAARRTPNIEGLNLEAAGVKFHAKGVMVDYHLRTSNPDIFSAGDISSSFQFTHAAEALGRIALQNAFFFGRKQASDLVVPGCI